MLIKKKKKKKKNTCKPNFFLITLFIFNKIKLGPFLPRVMLYELILINEIEQRAKIIFLSVLCAIA